MAALSVVGRRRGALGDGGERAEGEEGDEGETEASC